MKKTFQTLICAAFTLASTVGCGHVQSSENKAAESNENLPKVYFYKEINSENLVKIYEALGREAKGKVAVKLSTGEPGGHNFLQPALIKDLVQKVNGTIVECNTAYGGKRGDTQSHLQAAKDHGFTAIAPVDIMDAEGETELPVTGGKHLKSDIVGKNYLNYDFTVVLSHFKGHAMGGFGGAIKNISIGIASSNGKRNIHSAGASTTSWGNPEQDDFLESMAEAAKAVIDHCGENILYISVANNLSVDCDCDSSPADPQMGDIGILASLDPVALDKACTDLVRSSKDHGKIHLIERIDSRHGMHTLDYAEQLGIGSQKYELVELD
ncbi:DUF362 domain-containing protein [Bacteroides gallinaceum]|uniref:DUF362 domain-containing protein n=1 Tax=Bacteroides gallinaceum TaxID=1462571 RepID=UPI0025AAF6AA|nr:DUF362 domain-containing protein [Bacteroides gallinaceum]MDN0064952.1 DUF362 domain-containing protein [Bacteroides gallinaceum]